MDTRVFGSSSVDSIVREGYISQQGLANLANYKYSGSDLSFLYNLVLTHYFDWLVLRMPLWVAYVNPLSFSLNRFKAVGCCNTFLTAAASSFDNSPNVLTLVGVLFNYVFYFLLGYWTPYLTGEAPAWVYFVSAFCIFAYQSLDNIDGRQARRYGDD